MIATRLAITVLALVCATAAAAQTHAELLEKAIFTDETAGDLPEAIRIYEGLVSTPGVSREIAARAQARLADSRRRASASASARQTATPASPVVRSRIWSFAPQQQVEGCCGMFSGNYDPGRPVTARGRIIQVMWTNPQTLLVIDGFDGNRWGFTLPPPNALFLRGFKKDTFKLGEELMVGGFMAKGETVNCPAALPNACASLQNGALHASASIITASDGKVLFDWAEMRTMPAQPREQLQFDPAQIPPAR